MKRYWISWYQPTADYRPLTDPPNEAVLGWWNSGTRVHDNASTLCAVVEAADQDGAEAAIRKDWPEAEEWRFCEEKPATWTPNDRFPITKKWERERFAL